MSRTVFFGLALCVGAFWAMGQAPPPSATPPADPPIAKSAPQDSQTTAAMPGPDIFSQAPAGVEEALRARMKTFYDCYLTGTFRKAYELVAPDSKDAYFDAEKSTYHSYKVTRIDFVENYTKAKAIVVVNTDFKMQSHTMRVDVPMAANWKIVDGQWYWYVIPRPPGDGVATPFGNMYPNEKTDKSGTGAANPNAGVGRDPRAMAAAATAMPILVKPVLTLNAVDQFSDKTELMNRSKQKIKFHIDSEPIDGLMIDPYEAEIPPGKATLLKARLTSKKAPSGPKVMHLAYVQVEGGMRIQFYVAIEPEGSSDSTK